MEIWKDVIGYEGLYQVSNLGNVKSLEKKTKFGRSCKIHNERILKQSNTLGYLIISINKKCVKVHRLVAKAFIANPENKKQVNHINGIKTDNRVENLEWNTSKENNNHAVNIGLNKNYSIFNGNSKLNINEILFIRNSNIKNTLLSKKFNVTTTTIHHIKKLKTHKSLIEGKEFTIFDKSIKNS